MYVSTECELVYISSSDCVYVMSRRLSVELARDTQVSALKEQLKQEKERLERLRKVLKLSVRTSLNLGHLRIYTFCPKSHLCTLS